jgi:hypothetical protein
MKLLRLAVLGAAAYGAKKWLDENPNAKRQVREAADNAKLQARHAMDTARHEVDKRRHGGEGGAETGEAGTGFTADSEVPSSSMFGSATSGDATTTGSDPGLGAEAPTAERPT